MVTDFCPSVQAYIDPAHPPVFIRPATCPACQQANSLIGHGYYSRKAWDRELACVIWIKRWYCNACHATISLLPSFLLAYRHYVLDVIQSVVIGRYERGCSWKELARIASRRTVMRWCQAWGKHAERWLAEVLHTLAHQDSGCRVLDPLGEAAGPTEPAQALLSVTFHLLAWAKTRWANLINYGPNDRLRFLWHWGHGQGLGRLI